MLSKPHTRTVLLLFFAACLTMCQPRTERQVKSDTEKVIRDSVPKPRDEQWSAFFIKFKTDSVFQKSRMVFPLRYTTTGDEGEPDQSGVITASKMNFMTIFTANKPGDIIKQKKISPSEIKMIYQIADTGFEQDFTFLKKNGQWFMNSVRDLSD